MREPSHLYAVDSDGVTVPAPPSGPSGTTGQPAQRAKQKARPRFAVPTDRMKWPDTQIGSLIACCVASRNGQQPVTAADQANFMGVSAVTAALNNAFFVSVGLLKRVAKGAYMPTDLALRFQQKWSFDREGAPELLRPAFEGQWFLDAVKQRVQVGNPTVKQMVETLAGLAGTDATYEVQYKLLLNWLEYVGLITTTGGVVRVIDDADNDAPFETYVDAPPSDTLPPTAVTVPRKVILEPEPQLKPPVVSLSIEVTLTAEDLATLPPDAITALFDGIGKVAFVKAVIDRN